MLKNKNNNKMCIEEDTIGALNYCGYWTVVVWMFAKNNILKNDQMVLLFFIFTVLETFSQHSLVHKKDVSCPKLLFRHCLMDSMCNGSTGARVVSTHSLN